MKNNLLQVLLRRFFSARISPAEYTVLKSEVQKATDEAMDSALDILWKEQNLQIPVMDDAVKFRVLNNIQNQITDNKPSHNFFLDTNCGYNSDTASYFGSIILLLFRKVQQARGCFYRICRKRTKTQIFLPDGTQVWLNSVLISAILPYSIVIIVR